MKDELTPRRYLAILSYNRLLRAEHPKAAFQVVPLMMQLRSLPALKNFVKKTEDAEQSERYFDCSFRRHQICNNLSIAVFRVAICLNSIAMNKGELR